MTAGGRAGTSEIMNSPQLLHEVSFSQSEFGPTRFNRLTTYFCVHMSRASFASWLVQVWRREKLSCKLARASLAARQILVQVGSGKFGGATNSCASWLVQVWLCDKAGDFTGRTLLNAFGKKQVQGVNGI